MRIAGRGVIGFDMAAALALAPSFGASPVAVARFLPLIESAMVAALRNAAERATEAEDT